jgi:hypothetical protein
VLAVTTLMAAACGSPMPSPVGTTTASPPVVVSEPSPVQTTSPSPGAANGATPPASPQTSCPAVQAATTASNGQLALVALRGSDCFIVRDLTDISKAKTVGAFVQLSQPQFVSSSSLSYVDGPSVVRVPVSGFPKTVAARTSEYVIAFAWSPDGSTLAYVAPTSSGMALHLVSSGSDRVIGGSMPALPAVGCEVFCPTADKWDLRLSYSPDGTLISFVDSIVVPVFRLWTSEGSLVTSSSTQPHSMSAWSGKSFYFQDSKGVSVWKNGVVSSFLPGVNWIRPKASPDGRTIVYETRDSSGSAHTSIVDTTYGLVGELRTARAEPVFLTSRYIWYRGERPCFAADNCPAGYPAIPTGKTYIYDLQTGTESESIITSVFDVWPHAA